MPQPLVGMQPCSAVIKVTLSPNRFLHPTSTLTLA